MTIYIINFMRTAMQYILTIKIKDIIDIAILAFIIYKGMMLVRKTNTSGVMKGIVLFLAALIVASQFHLNALTFLMNRVVELGVIALVVVFQPEIRRFLEQVGSSRIFDLLINRDIETTEIEKAVEQTVIAYESMSKDKVGALIVFERNISLREYIKTGTPLDCEMNAELLKNLFWNKAPLHDGALIVRDGRVVGAGCMLPLSTNPSISRELGMRHRAGIGISEHSDAVVAIVSEETGGISVAISGSLKRHLAPDTLQRVLMNELMPSDQQVQATTEKIKNHKLVSRILGRKDDSENAEENH